MITTRNLLFLVLVVPFAVVNADPQHQHADMPQQLGSVHFPISCESRVQDTFARGVALLHSFWYEEAEKAFRTVLQDDPKCAMAHWGIAMAQWHQIAGWPDADGIKVAQQALASAETLKTTAAERAYISALALFFRNSDQREPLERATAYSRAMSRIYQDYPADMEAGAFYALSLLASEPENDTTFANRKKAGKVLEKLFAVEPDHPGVAHYLIHAYDKPQLAQLGLPAAERYAKIAPASPHALHMPSHIFARLGMWQPDIDSNLASVAATEKVLAMHMEGAAHQFHAMDFLLYAYLQTGREAEAQQLIEKVQLMPANEAYKWGGYDWHRYSKAEYPAVYTLELRDWSAATELKLVPDAPSFASTLTYWGRSIGAARSGKAALARSNALQIKSIHDVMIASHESYFEDYVLQEFQEASAWADYADGRLGEAIDTLRSIAEKQEAVGDEPTGIPAREMLADLLLDARQPEKALSEYERDLKFNPNRFNGLYGAGLAAEQAGQLQKSREFYRQLTTVCADSKSRRPELAHAAKMLKQPAV
jgi:tetratricopeptide (TPR) repeat protein